MSDCYYKNSDGETVFDMAKRHNIKGVIKFLVKQEKIKKGGSTSGPGSPDKNIVQPPI